MKRLIIFLFLFLIKSGAYAQCKYAWAQWTDQGMTDTAVASILVNGATVNMTMTANFAFDFTPTIFNYPAFAGYPDLPANDTVIRTTWAAGPGGQTTMCFSQPVTNPVLLLASLGNLSAMVTLNFSLPYNVLFDGGGNTFVSTTSLDALEGFCIIEFPGTFSCVTIFSSTPEFYTNLTWGIKNPLTAGFTFSNVCGNQPVVFSSATSFINPPGSIIAYNWDFHDGSTSTLANPSHTFASPGNHIVTLIITSDNLCTDTLTQIVPVLSSYSINNPQSICSGQTYSVNTHVYSGSGTYYDTLLTASGCDSIVVTQLTVSPVSSFANPQTVCGGGSYSINSHVYTTTGSYSDTLSSVSGCDSVVNTQLNVIPVSNTNNPQTICNGAGYSFNSHVYTVSGTYYDTLSSVAGCDSIVTTQLIIGSAGITNNLQSICAGQTYTFNSHLYNSSGTYYDTLAATTGCDSVIVTVMTVNPVPVVTFAHPADVCVEAPVQVLNYAAPVGGVYSGTGVVNNTFDPGLANAGLHQLNYSYSDPSTNCINTVHENITVHPSPVINFSVDPKRAFIENAKISFIDLTQGAVSWYWDFGDNSISQYSSGVHVYSDTGHYEISLIVSDVFGCKNVSQEAVFIGNEFTFYVPNSFTPNGDGVNDLFNGNGVGINEYNMTIYDRWGKQIFETNDFNKSWSGKNAPGDTYVYKINLSDSYGLTHEYIGKVSVVY